MTRRAGWVQALTAECEAEAASLQPPEGDAALRRAIVERLEVHGRDGERRVIARLRKGKPRV